MYISLYVRNLNFGHKDTNEDFLCYSSPVLTFYGEIELEFRLRTQHRGFPLRTMRLETRNRCNTVEDAMSELIEQSQLDQWHKELRIESNMPSVDIHKLPIKLETDGLTDMAINFVKRLIEGSPYLIN